jgi:hypothetical protein
MTKVIKKCVFMMLMVAMLVGTLVCFSACGDSRLGTYEYKDSNGNVLSSINAKSEHKADVTNLYYNGGTTAAKTGSWKDCYFNLDDDGVVTLKVKGVGYFGQLNGTTLSMSSEYGVNPSSDYQKK